MKMEKSSSESARKDKVKSTLSSFKNITDETEVSNLCEDLVKIINEGEEDDRKIALSEATKMLIELDKADALHGTKILLSVIKEVGKLDVIPLIAEILLDPSDWFVNDVTVDLETIMTVSFCKDLIAAAGSDNRYLKLVMEIFMDHASDSTTLEMFPNLLAVVNTRWQDTDLVHWTLDLFVESVESISSFRHNDKERDFSMERKLLTSISVLASVVFSNNPNSMDLTRKLDCRMDDSEPMSSLLVSAFYLLIESEAFLKDYSAALKIMRLILPIIIHVLDNIIRDYLTVIELESTENFIQYSVDLISFFVSLTKENACESEQSLKLFLSSNLMEKLLTLQETATRENVCCHGEAGRCGPISECLFFQGVKASFLIIAQGPTAGFYVSEGHFVIIKVLKHFLVNESIFNADGKELENMMPYGELSIKIIETIYHTCRDDIRKSFSDPEENLIPLTIQFISRHSSLLKFVCEAIMNIALKFGVKELSCHLISFPSICLNHFLSNKDLIKRSIKLKARHVICSEDLERMDNLIIVSAMYITKEMFLSATLLELQEMEAKFNILDLIMKVLKVSKNPDITAAFMAILYSAIDKHQLDLFDIEKLAVIFPDVWKKTVMSNSVEENVLRFTYKIVLLLPNLSALDFSDFMPIVIDASKSVHRLKSRNPGLIRLIWELIRQQKHKQLFKNLHLLSAGKVVEFASPGKHELARIFKLLSDIIVELMEADPPCAKEHLIDLTKCMIEIAKTSSLDEELYVLEDMVSPAMWLLEKQHDESIVANVKKFVRILH